MRIASTRTRLVLALAGMLGWALGAIAGPPRTQDRAAQGDPARLRGELPDTLGVTFGPRLPGAAVYPRQELNLRFDHAKHLARGLDCRKCHTAVTSSRRVEDSNFPRPVVCDECHGAQHPRPSSEPAHCDLCHTRVEGARVMAGLRAPPALLQFDHAGHLARGATCAQCHGDMTQVRLATTLQLPAEASCLTCHDGVRARAECTVCHPSDAGGRMVTRARDDRVSPPLVPKGRSAWGMNHDLGFVENHASVAKARAQACTACHDDHFCQDCHSGPVRPMRLHSGDYLTLHAMDARAGRMDCQSCHRAQTFCLGCHERLGFADRAMGPWGPGGGRSFHPTGWAGAPGQPQGHAFAAQRNVSTCVSCHSEDSCLGCHATTGAARPGLSVSPHGAGFANSARCTALSEHNRRACLKCHAPGDPQNDCF